MHQVRVQLYTRKPAPRRNGSHTQHNTTQRNTTQTHPSRKYHLPLTEMPRKTATNAGSGRSRSVKPRRAPPPAISPVTPTSTITGTTTAPATAAAVDTVTCACPPFRDRHFSGRCRYHRRGSVYSIAEGALHFARGDFLVGMVGAVGRSDWLVGRSVFRSVDWYTWWEVVMWMGGLIDRSVSPVDQ